MAIKYKWLADLLRTEIHKQLSQGNLKLPTEAALCKKYHVSRQTVRDAQTLLINEGLIEKVQGSGAYIIDRNSENDCRKIAILIPDENKYLYPSLLADVKNALLSADYEAVVFNTECSVIKEREILTDILDNKIRPAGIIAEGVNTALPNPNTDLYRSIMQMNIPVVFALDYFPKLTGECHLCFDDFKGLSALMQYLISEGHTKIGGIYSRNDYSGVSRYEYHLRYLIEKNMPVSDDFFCWYDNSLIDSLRETRDTALLSNMLKKVSSECTAIICQNDEMAYYISRTGTDLSVAAFDRSYLSSGILNSVASLAAEPHSYGTRLAEMIIAKIRGRNVYSEEITRFLKAGRTMP